VTCGARKGQDRKDADGEIESKHDGAGLGRLYECCWRRPAEGGDGRARKDS
jgi:hypothetical protein